MGEEEKEEEEEEEVVVVVCWPLLMFPIRLGDVISVDFLLNSVMKKNWLRTDRRTDRRTDQRTDGPTDGHTLL